MNISLRQFDSLIHIGKLEPSSDSTSRYSYEGSGLSVSQHPEAWRKIARLAGEAWQVLKRTDNPISLIDYHAIADDPAFKEQVAQFGMTRDLINPATLFKVTTYDCETEEEFSSLHRSYDDAFVEADEDDDCIMQVDGWVATDKLCELSRVSKIDAISAFEYTAILYLESLGQADGIWWDDELDISSLSAPRGVIFPSRLSDFQAVQGDQVNVLSTIVLPKFDALSDDPLSQQSAPKSSPNLSFQGGLE